MNNPLTTSPSVPPLDAAYAKRDRKEARRFWGSLIVAILAIAGTTYAIVSTHEVKTEVTQIQHSACAANPAGHECQEIKAESDRKQPVKFACIPFHRVGYACPKPGSKAAKRLASGGGASQPGSTGSQPSGPSSGGHGTGNAPSHTAPPHQEPEHPGVSNPPSTPTPSQPSSPAAPSAPEAHEEPAGTPTTPEATPAAKQPIRETVAGVGETVNGALEGVGHTGCKLLGCQNP